MSKAKKVLETVKKFNKLCEEFKIGDNASFKDGAEKGMVGLIVNIQKDGSVDLKLGAATKVAIPAARLELVTITGTEGTQTAKDVKDAAGGTAGEPGKAPAEAPAESRRPVKKPVAKKPLVESRSKRGPVSRRSTHKSK